MRTTITLPDLGVSTGTRITLSAWFAMPGDRVLEGDRLVEILTEGATFDVPCPASGCLVEHRAFPRDVLTTGQILGVVESPDEVQ